MPPKYEGYGNDKKRKSRPDAETVRKSKKRGRMQGKRRPNSTINEAARRQLEAIGYLEGPPTTRSQ